MDDAADDVFLCLIVVFLIFDPEVIPEVLVLLFFFLINRLVDELEEKGK